MSEETQDDVVALAERMLRFFGAKKLHITWFGGEPLMNAEVIWNLTPRLRGLAESCGAEYSADIFTNGSLLTQETAQTLFRHHARVVLKFNSLIPEIQERMTGAKNALDKQQK